MIKCLVRWCLTPLLVVVMAGCGGTDTNNTATVSGVVAAGSVLVGNVYLKDSSVPAKELSAPIAADGSFQFDLAGLTAPFILRASGTVNGRPTTLYSFTPAAGIANINPLSNLALVLASGRDDLASLFYSVSADEMRIIANFMVTTVPAVQATLRPTLARFGAEAVNFISDPYKANHQGLDLMLDMATISASGGVVTLFDKTSGNAVQANFTDFRTRTIDFILNPTTKIGAVCIAQPPSVHFTESVALTAYVIGLDDQRVTWSVVEENGGSITATGVYTAPATVGTFHVTATSIADPTKSATTAIGVSAPTAANSVYVVSSGLGEYSIMGVNFSNVDGVQIVIGYDNNALSNPRITRGDLLATSLFIANTTYMPNRAIFAAASLTAITGSGTLAKISFDLLGAAPNPPVIISKKFSAIAPPTPPVGGGITPVPELPPPSAGGAVPGGTVSGSTVMP